MGPYLLLHQPEDVEKAEAARRGFVTFAIFTKSNRPSTVRDENLNNHESTDNDRQSSTSVFRSGKE